MTNDRAKRLCATVMVAGTVIANAACDGHILGGDAARDARTDARAVDAAADTAPTTDVPNDLAHDAPPVDVVGPTDVPVPVDVVLPSDVPPPPDGGPCTSGSIASRIVVTPAGGEIAYPTSDNGAVVGGNAGGTIAVQGYDPAGGVFGPRIDVTGDGLWGLAASPTAYGVLVSRSDQLVLVIVPRTGGAPTHEERLMGGNDHTVTNNEWFGVLLRAGRADWNGSSWVTYSTVQRLWPDGIAHYGDTLRTFNADGTPSSVLWDWGCSHSMEVRLTHPIAGGDIGATCSSDCYPGKGVYYMHNTLLFTDNSGNCAGYVAQRLGGLTAVSTGYLAGFTSPEGRASSDPAIVSISSTGAVGTVQWLSSAAGDASDLHVVRFGSGAFAAWNEGGAGHLQMLDASGAAMGTEEAIDSGLLSGASDFFSYANGDVGWLSSRGLVRLPACH